MSTTRRELLRNSALTGAGIMIAGSFGSLFDIGTAAAKGAGPSGGYGPLVPDPAGLLDLPAGFRYNVLFRSQA